MRQGSHQVSKLVKATVNKEFVFWDGEGANDADGRHQYILFGCSTGGRIEGPSLATVDCLALLMKVEVEAPDSIHVIFAGKYDVNMILKDLHWVVLKKLHETGTCTWYGYKITYASGKFLRVSKRIDGRMVTATMFDVWAFFACSFVVACSEYLGVSPALEEIESGKARRNSFTYDDMDFIRGYWQSELDYGVDLCDKLRDNLEAAGIFLTQWHGPGAISSVILRTNGIKEHMMPTPPDVLPIVQHAYAGGRSEQFCGGTYYGKVYQYDINQAYPAAIRRLPSLARATWSNERHVEGIPIRDFAVYRVSARNPYHPDRDARPYPLFWRGRYGEVYFPKDIEGWYWGPEVRRSFGGQYDSLVIHESWELSVGTERPFDYINDMAVQRREWKLAKNPAHIAYKLGMNSTYGKMAQRVGAHRGGPPTWHQLDWAGLICAYARAQLYDALSLRPDALISCSTDSVFSTVPLDLPVSDQLGDWDLNVSDGICILQSGVYWLLDSSGDWKAKYRGFDAGTLSIDSAFDYLRRCDDAIAAGRPVTEHLTATSTRFMTWSQTKGSRKWRQWVTSPRMLEFGSPLSKRGHYPKICPQCRDGLSLTQSLHTFHTSGLPWIGKSMSAAHSLPWSSYGDDSHYPFDGDDVSLAG